jgi:uncharacterized glyoxalase superfamily protein PhnB
MAYTTPDVIPTFHYKDAPAAIDWLERAFGFERHAVYEEDGVVHHAELRVGSNGMIMLGTARENPYGMKTPNGSGVTGAVYVIVDEPDAHHDRAVAAGAEVIQELRDEDYGSRGYTSRDPEGHVWHFGTYRPAAQPGSQITDHASQTL